MLCLLIYLCVGDLFRITDLENSSKKLPLCTIHLVTNLPLFHHSSLLYKNILLTICTEDSEFSGETDRFAFDARPCRLFMSLSVSSRLHRIVHFIQLSSLSLDIRNSSASELFTARSFSFIKTFTSLFARLIFGYQLCVKFVSSEYFGFSSVLCLSLLINQSDSDYITASLCFISMCFGSYFNNLAKNRKNETADRHFLGMFLGTFVMESLPLSSPHCTLITTSFI